MPWRDDAAIPLATGGRTVPPDWIDYIGHMMDAYYFVAFTSVSATGQTAAAESTRSRATCASPRAYEPVPS
jgi:hypothetical protein